MKCRCTAGIAFTVVVCLVGAVGAKEPSQGPQREPVEVRLEGTAPTATTMTRRSFRTKDDPEVEPLDRDEFLGQVEPAMSTQSFSERIDPFSGTLHLNMVDLVLPGNGGLDIVIQHYYSSQVWNRVDNSDLARHSASADPSDRLGGGGWQLHMGKLMNPNPDVNQFTTLIMPDGATHTLYNRDGYSGQKTTQEGWIHTVDPGTGVHTVQTTTGLKYIFNPTAPGADYYYLAMKNLTEPIEVYQCTRIEDLNGNAIVIEYSDAPGAVGYEMRIDRVSFVDQDDPREIEFTYWGTTGVLDTMQLQNNGVPVETWTFLYYSPAFGVLQPQFFGMTRMVNQFQGIVHSLTGDWENEQISNPWLFRYYDDNTPLSSGQHLLKEVITPRVGKLTYTWGAEVMETGSQSCGGVAFLTVQTRQSAVGIDQLPNGDIIYEDEAATSYTYTNGGKEDATTDIITTDSQTSVVLSTEEHVFHGWGPYVAFDPYMWKVGRSKSSTIVINDDAGEDFETTTITTVWEQESQFSADSRWTSLWVGCGSSRNSWPQAYVKPTTVTRVVERHDSIPVPPPDPPPDPASYTTVSTGFDNWGNVGLITESSSDGLSRTTTLTYWQDPVTNIMVGRVEGRDPDPGGAECHQYDVLGRLSTSFTNPAIDDVSECSPTDPVAGTRRVDFSYYADGNLETRTERSTPHDRVTTHTNYQYGSPRETIVATGTGEDIHYCREYEPLGMVSWETDGRGCDTAYQTAYAYDLLGRLESFDPPLSDTTSFSYFNDWTQVTVTRGGQEFIYGYDRFGSLTDVYNSQTGHWIQITNDALGRRRQVHLLWNPEPGDTFTYDPLGRLTAVIHPDTDTDPNTQITVTYEGSKVTVEDENVHKTQYYYEAFGDPADRRLASLVDATDYSTTYGYDPVFGLLSTITAPISQGNRSFEYFSGSADCDNGFLAGETHPESGETTYQYNCLGAVTRRTRPGPEITIYGHDRAGRLTEISYPGDAGTVTMDYDQASRRTLLTNISASSASTYDDAGRLEMVTQSIVGGPQGNTTTYTYDTLDRLETITYPSGRVLTYWWDDRNWLVSLTGEDGSGVAYLPSITYHKTGTPDLVTFANGVTTDHQIDERNRLTGIVTPGLTNIGIEYDYASNVETWTDHLLHSKSRSYGYDRLDRLTSATAAEMWGSLGFTYDELGNRETRTLNGETTINAYDHTKNRLISLSGAETGAFTYDNAGRLETEERWAPGEIFSDGFESGDTNAWDEGGAISAATLIYTFNSADQLTRIERAGQTLGQYTFDGDGLRVSKTVDGQTVYYLRDPSGNTLAEFDQASTLLAEYLYAGGRQVAKVAPDGVGGDDVSYFHPDNLGTALHITDGSGAITWSGDYYPFGEEYSSSGTPDRYRFTQHELDPGTALIYAKARYYHPRIGRFLSVDPVGGEVGSSQSWNRYAYVLNNPVNEVDPTGMWVGLDDLFFTLGGAAVGLAGQGVGDIISILRGGEASGWEDYVGAAAGGAAGGEALLYTGPVAAGAIGASVMNLTKQGLKNLSGKQEGIDATSLAIDTTIGAATGLIPGAKVPGVTAGRGSHNQVYKQIVTRAQSGQISSVRPSTAAKMFSGHAVDTGLIPGAGAAGAAGGSGFLPSSEERRPPRENQEERFPMVPSH